MRFLVAAQLQIGQVGEVVAAGRAVLAAEEDDLEVPVVPRLDREHSLEVGFGAFDRRAVREAPPVGEAVDVRVDGEGGHAERLRHHDAGRLVADPGQRLEELPVADDLATLIDDLVGGEPQILRLGRREPDLTDVAEDLVGIHRRHLLRCAGRVEQRRGDLVHLLVGGLRGERHRDKQRVGVAVVERDRHLRVELVEDLTDPLGLLDPLHAGTLPTSTDSESGASTITAS